MKVLHGTWVPETNNGYIREGSFFLWAESSKENGGNTQMRQHIFSLPKKELLEMMNNKLNIGKDYYNSNIEQLFFTIPACDGEPLKSYELMTYSGEEIPEKFELQSFRIECCKIPETQLIKVLNELHFQLMFSESDIIIATDLLYWFHYTQSLKEVILKDQYIPFLKYHISDKKDNDFKLYPAWKIVSDKYEKNIIKYSEIIPQICLSTAREYSSNKEFFTAESLLRHFSENIIKQMIRNTKFPTKFQNQVKGTIIEYFITNYRNEYIPVSEKGLLEKYKKWLVWKDKILESHTDNKFNLYFKLEEAKNENEEWQVHLLIESKKEKELIPLKTYWNLTQTKKNSLKKSFGPELEKNILMSLGYAARIYPKIWEALDTDQPSTFSLNIEEAFDFLKEKSFILEDSGYKVIMPEWWNPQIKYKAKLRLKTITPKSMGRVNNKLFTTESLINYQYQLAIGNETVSEEEWKKLVNTKTPLVKFRGEWLELDLEKMREMYDLWKKNADKEKKINLLDMMKLAADESRFEIQHDKTLFEMMTKLRDKTKFELIKTPKKFKGNLRKYQQRGVSWIQYLETLGLNGCLADDMGLGKTIQVIAMLINEKEENEKLSTLLVAPTSVLGNWKIETAKFAPNLKTVIHHGSKRINDKSKFKEMFEQNDIIITSYSLLKKDEGLFKSVDWHRIIIDEAQNIKNPKSAQTKSLLQLKSEHKLALTGTPIENRLLDLWSIFNFLNHGYLDSHTAFRKLFEIPIQKENNRDKANLLKNLVEPFILRRLKTDQSIIKDLPDKVEQIVYCNLTKEQGSLYEAVVKDIEKQLNEKEGIERKGLILASLLRLKQICNHPLQFLQDNSEFSGERSYKLSRLAEMIEEIISSGESLLIFSQFREICEELNQFIIKKMHYKTFLLHGGINRTKRQKMIEEFQNPETEPSVFILSLKAGGVGITLTKANHVFHFDRWWNPAVEEQATDRAFRIGQKKNVFVHKFLAIGTLEEKINQLIEDKKKLSGSIIGSDESWLTELDNDSFKKLIALNKNAVME